SSARPVTPPTARSSSCAALIVATSTAWRWTCGLLIIVSDVSANSPADRQPAAMVDGKSQELSIRALTDQEAARVPEIWNAAWSAVAIGTNPYPLSPTLWAERLGSRHHDPTL